MGLVFRDEAEFWMNFNDFVALFSTIELCNLPPDAPLETPHLWSVFSFKGRWKRGVNAGGRPICKGGSAIPSDKILEIHLIRCMFKFLTFTGGLGLQFGLCLQ